MILLFCSVTALSQQEYLIKEILLVGNNKTKDYIILRELTFQQGDRMGLKELNEKLKKGEENLINTSLFHFAEMRIENIDSTQLRINVQLTERWYLWPVPEADIDERNFNAWLEHRSLSRISAGMYVNHSNSRGRMETWSLTLIAGHNQQFGFAYEFPYINKSKTLGFGLSTLYSARHEVNVSTLDNKQEFLKLKDEYAMQSFTHSVWFRHRPNIYFSQQFSTSYKQHNISDSIVLRNSDYTNNQNTRLAFLSAYYKLKIDHRNYKSYPLKGYYADLELQKDGFGLMDIKGDGYFSAKTTLRKYAALNKRFYAAAAFIGKYSTQQMPYILQRGLGYNRDFVRGYEYYVVDGSSFGLVKANLKYALIQQRKLKLSFIPTEKFNTIPYAFYLNIYSDLGYVHSSLNQPSNTLQNSWLAGYGVGLDFVTYYDWVMRMEYSRNKMGEGGFFLHFIAPI